MQYYGATAILWSHPQAGMKHMYPHAHISNICSFKYLFYSLIAITDTECLVSNVGLPVPPLFSKNIISFFIADNSWDT